MTSRAEPIVEPAGDRLDDALWLLLRRRSDSLQANFEQAHALIRTGAMDPNGVLIARSGSVIVGAIFVQPVRGNVAVLWPPQVIGGAEATADADADSIADLLVRRALDRTIDVRWVQSFTTEEDAADGDSLQRFGFQRITTILDLRLAAETAEPHRGTRSGHWIRRDTIGRLEFQNLIIRCISRSLDIPELDGNRDPDEVWDGLCESAPDPSTWFALSDRGSLLGVLIMNNCEVSLLGVVPEARGQGWGRSLIGQARAVSENLSLSVDKRNSPAIGLYLSEGFKICNTRELFLLHRLWRR